MNLLIKKQAPNKSMKVSVKTMTGKMSEFEVDDSVLDLMTKISEGEQLPMDTLHLIYGGKSLHENTLSHYGIQEGSCIHLQLRLRGGMFHPTSSRNDYTSVHRTALLLDIQFLEEILKRIVT